jgi:hypothetical protein
MGNFIVINQSKRPIEKQSEDAAVQPLARPLMGGVFTLFL